MSQICALPVEELEFEEENLDMLKLSLHMQTYVVMKQVVSRHYMA